MAAQNLRMGFGHGWLQYIEMVGAINEVHSLSTCFSVNERKEVERERGQEREKKKKLLI